MRSILKFLNFKRINLINKKYNIIWLSLSAWESKKWQQP